MPRRIPDGEHLLRLVLSDAQTRNPDERLTGEAVSRSFLIDNTRPPVDDSHGGGYYKGRKGCHTKTALAPVAIRVNSVLEKKVE
ncbi:MAG: hypothetical protein ACOC0A_04800 [Planctomycetota bacterium]